MPTETILKPTQKNELFDQNPNQNILLEYKTIRIPIRIFWFFGSRDSDREYKSIRIPDQKDLNRSESQIRIFCFCLLISNPGPHQFAAKWDSETGYNSIPISCRALGAGIEIVSGSLGRPCSAKTVQLFCDVWITAAIMKRFLWPKVRNSFLNEKRSNSHGTGIHFVPEHVLQGLKYILLL